MKIKINFMGMLSKYTGVESVDIELPDDARYGDLLDEIGARYGADLPEKCWDRNANEFIKPISAIGSNGDVELRDTPLTGTDEIHILIPISGGAFL
jgi:molybdopterin converting factor small subunit